MKTLLNTYLALLSVMLIVCSCDDVTYDPVLSNDTNTTLKLSSTAVVLTQYTETETAITATWAEPDFGFNAANPSYVILVSLSNDDFSNAQSLTAVTTLSKAITGQELNTKLLNLGLETDVETTVYLALKTVLSNVNALTSEPVALTVTPYSAILDLSTTWGIVGSAASNGWNGPDMPFYQTGTDGEYVAYVSLTDGEIKFRENNEWTLNYGDTDTDGTLDEGGTNIPVSAGTYKINLDLNKLTYSIEAYSWGIVGDGVPNGWNGPDTMLEYDPTSDQWRALVTLSVDGEIKFRTNNKWALNYGDDDADGTLDEGGKNIAVKKGNYLITVNFNKLTYSLEAIDLWGIVGSATPNDWNGPDIPLKLDYTSDGMVWYNNSFDLIDGQIKFRTNNKWELNYGDKDTNGILDQENENNINVTAGNYSVSINLEDLSYTLEKK